MLEAMKRCMRFVLFVLCSRNAGLLLKPSRNWDGSNEHQFHIRGKLDSDYAKDTQTRQSVSGYVVYLEDAPTMHRSTSQKTVALLSCKAELNAVAVVLCMQDMIYQKNALESIGLKVELPMILEMDNKTTREKLILLIVSVSVRDISTLKSASCKNSRKQKC